MNEKLNKSNKIRIRSLIFLVMIVLFVVFRLATSVMSSSNTLLRHDAHHMSDIIGEVVSISPDRSNQSSVLLTVRDSTGEAHPIFAPSKNIDRIHIGDRIDVLMEDGKIKSIIKIPQRNL